MVTVVGNRLWQNFYTLQTHLASPLKWPGKYLTLMKKRLLIGILSAWLVAALSVTSVRILQKVIKNFARTHINSIQKLIHLYFNCSAFFRERLPETRTQIISELTTWRKGPIQIKNKISLKLKQED